MPTGSRSWRRAAEAAERAGELSGRSTAWNQAVGLLPPRAGNMPPSPTKSPGWGVRSSREVRDRTRQLPRPLQPVRHLPLPLPLALRWSGGAVSGVMATLALALWKFKFMAALLLTKGKILLLGLTKASTFLSMFLTAGLYWSIFGLWFAVGLVLSIYVHEMGHVFALTRYGIHAGAPLFVPGLGRVHPIEAGVDRPETRRTGRAGRTDLGTRRGLGVSRSVCSRPGSRSLVPWRGLVPLSNLFNLLPIWHLDGGRAFRSLTRSQALAGPRRDRCRLGRYRRGIAGLVAPGRRCPHRYGQTE